MNVASSLARIKLFGRPDNLAYSRAEVEQLQSPLNAIFASVQKQHPYYLVRTDDYLCSPTVCPAHVGDVPLYSDAHHVTPAAAPFLAPAFARLLPE